MPVKHQRKAGDQGFDVFQFSVAVYKGSTSLFHLIFSIRLGLIASEEAALYGLLLVRISIKKYVHIVFPPPTGSIAEPVLTGR